MRVLFLAVGATRRRAVTAEIAEVLAAGGEAVLVVDSRRPWRGEHLDPRVRVVDLAAEEGRRPVFVAERRALLGAPLAVLRLAGRGPLRRAGRAGEAYQRRLAAAVHSRVTVPAYRRIRPQARRRLIERVAGPLDAFDLVVVADPMSLPEADRLRTSGRRDGGAPVLCYSIDQVGPAAPRAGWPRPAAERGR